MGFKFAHFALPIIWRQENVLDIYRIWWLGVGSERKPNVDTTTGWGPTKFLKGRFDMEKFQAASGAEEQKKGHKYFDFII